MDAETLLASLKLRFGSKIARIAISADEIQEWPEGVFDRLRTAKLLNQIEPAQSLECYGCEQACFMPVNIIAADGGRPALAFIACDKPENYGRIKVEFSRLHQWQLAREGFDKLQCDWIVSPAGRGKAALKKSKANAAFRGALESLLEEIARRSSAQGLPFDYHAMPGRKIDLQAIADKYDPALEFKQRTFDDYLDGLCAFKRGARQTTFYSDLFPEYFK